MLFIFLAYLYPPTHYIARSDSEHSYVTRVLVVYVFFRSVSLHIASVFFSCNRIKWRMISYFLTSNYTTAVLIWLMRWKGTERKRAETIILKIIIIEICQWTRAESNIKKKIRCEFVTRFHCCNWANIYIFQYSLAGWC